ncbi:hypothetical protein [Bosea sp. (in: a-proteobacteria)]|jgi:hypothetical protein|uniref:Uncharacterized protein n=1 Tax=Bosea vestrisii TaxID=151416 RepID=A0ABW0H8E2_9HYPH|nr:hypothetical protein [Bosea sp. (in: a-proteobacteria)]MBR3190390.1 hypothetical protein [Bosea sp. (in: a-proteobacteria)]
MSIASTGNVFGWLGNHPGNNSMSRRVASHASDSSLFSLSSSSTGSSALPAGGSEATTSAGAGSAREWGWEASGLRAEIKVNGEVVGRVYNNGAVELADEYGYLGKQLGWGGASEARLDGPDLADKRIAQALDALKKVGAKVEFAATALTQEQWLASFSTSIGRNVDRSI